MKKIFCVKVDLSNGTIQTGDKEGSNLLKVNTTVLDDHASTLRQISHLLSDTLEEIRTAEHLLASQNNVFEKEISVLHRQEQNLEKEEDFVRKMAKVLEDVSSLYAKTEQKLSTQDDGIGTNTGLKEAFRLRQPDKQNQMRNRWISGWLGANVFGQIDTGELERQIDRIIHFSE